MALINRLDHDEGFKNIPNHGWSAAMWLFAKGNISKQNVMDSFEIDPVLDEPQLDQLIAHYQGLSPEGKAEFHSTLEACGVLLELGLLTKAAYLNLLGMS